MSKLHADSYMNEPADRSKVVHDIDTRLSILNKKLSNLSRDIEDTALSKVDHLLENLDESILAVRMTLTQAAEALSAQLADAISAARHAVNVPRHVEEAPLASVALSVLLGLTISGLKSPHSGTLYNQNSGGRKASDNTSLSPLGWMIKPIVSTITIEILRHVVNSQRQRSNHEH